MAPIEREIRALAAGLTAVKDEQEYIVVRERTHRNTAESTNSRVKWWSVMQAIVLFLVVAWQVYYLKVNTLSLHSVVATIYTTNSYSRSSRSSGHSSHFLYLIVYIRSNSISSDSLAGSSLSRRQSGQPTLCASKTGFYQSSVCNFTTRTYSTCNIQFSRREAHSIVRRVDEHTISYQAIYHIKRENKGWVYMKNCKKHNNKET